MHEICRKDHLARNVNRLSRLFPKAFGFFPKTWVLPVEKSEFLLYHKTKRNSTFIAKPDHGCQGKGIFLFKDPATVPDLWNGDMVVQTYIASPCLVDGLKFDLRVYVLVTSVDPLRVFVYQDGLARFSTEKYSSPSASNLDNVCMHLTNYAINKHSEKFVRDSKVGNKRSIKSVLEELEKKKGSNTSEIWDKMCDAIVKTLLVVQPQLARILKGWFPTDEAAKIDGSGSQCFEILGFDIMLDSKFKPWVLEVNHSPSFACDSPIDREIKSGVISDALKLINQRASSQKKFVKSEKAKSQSRLWKSTAKQADSEVVRQEQPNVQSSLPEIELQSRTSSARCTVSSSTPPRPTSTNKILIKADAFEKYQAKYPPTLSQKLQESEDKNLGQYLRIFPPENHEKFLHYLYILAETGKISSETNSTKARKAFLAQKREHETAKLRLHDNWKARHERQHPNIIAKVDTKGSMGHPKPSNFLFQFTSINSSDTEYFPKAMASKYQKTVYPWKSIISVSVQNFSEDFLSDSTGSLRMYSPKVSRTVVKSSTMLKMESLLQANQRRRDRERALNVISKAANIKK